MSSNARDIVRRVSGKGIRPTVMEANLDSSRYGSLSSRPSSSPGPDFSMQGTNRKAFQEELKPSPPPSPSLISPTAETWKQRSRRSGFSADTESSSSSSISSSYKGHFEEKQYSLKDHYPKNDWRSERKQPMENDHHHKEQHNKEDQQSRVDFHDLQSTKDQHSLTTFHLKNNSKEVHRDEEGRHFKTDRHSWLRTPIKEDLTPVEDRSSGEDMSKADQRPWVRHHLREKLATGEDHHPDEDSKAEVHSWVSHDVTEDYLQKKEDHSQLDLPPRSKPPHATNPLLLHARTLSYERTFGHQSEPVNQSEKRTTPPDSPSPVEFSVTPKTPPPTLGNQTGSPPEPPVPLLSQRFRDLKSHSNDQSQTSAPPAEENLTSPDSMTADVKPLTRTLRLASSGLQGKLKDVPEEPSTIEVRFPLSI